MCKYDIDRPQGGLFNHNDVAVVQAVPISQEPVIGADLVAFRGGERVVDEGRHDGRFETGVESDRGQKGLWSPKRRTEIVVRNRLDTLEPECIKCSLNHRIERLVKAIIVGEYRIHAFHPRSVDEVSTIEDRLREDPLERMNRELRV